MLLQLKVVRPRTRSYIICRSLLATWGRFPAAVYRITQTQPLPWFADSLEIRGDLRFSCAGSGEWSERRVVGGRPVKIRGNICLPHLE